MDTGGSKMLEGGGTGQPVLWGQLSWRQVRELAKQPSSMAIWPIGTTEQHGHHLPTDVDMRNCWEVALGVSAATGVPLLPGLPYGNSSYWAGWPGTLSIGADTLRSVVCDVAAGLAESGFKRLLLLNGHVGNGPAMTLSEIGIRESIPDLQVRALSWWDVSPRVSTFMYADSIEGQFRSFHANDGETSVYLAHSSELVALAEAVDEPTDYERSVFSYHSRKLTRSGAIGAPSRANADRGEEIVRMAIEDVVALVRRGMDEDVPSDVWGVGSE